MNVVPTAPVDTAATDRFAAEAFTAYYAVPAVLGTFRGYAAELAKGNARTEWQAMTGRARTAPWAAQSPWVCAAQRGGFDLRIAAAANASTVDLVESA